MKNYRRLGRRAFLASSAAAGVLAPFIPASVGQAEATGPKRFILFWTPNGLYEPEWTPTDAFEFNRILAPVSSFKDRILFFKNLDWQSYFADPSNPANDHPPPLSHGLCAANVVDYAGGDAHGGGPSVDQVIAQRISADRPFPSLLLTSENNAATRRLSYRAAREVVPPISEPSVAFDAMFRELDGTDDTVARVRAERQSVIDLVRDELQSFENRVGTDDRIKIDAHLTHLRTVERQIAAGTDLSGCTAPNLAEHDGEPDFVRRGRQHLDIMASAIACDLTRVASIEWDGANTTHSWAGVDHGHHTLAHYQTDLSHGETNESLVRIGIWYAEQFKYLLEKLASIGEGDSTALDNSVVLWTSEHRALHGDHGRRDVPFLTAGSAGGYFRTGRKIECAGRSHSDLLVSLCHSMGLEDVSSFGNPDVCTGPVPDLT